MAELKSSSPTSFLSTHLPSRGRGAQDQNMRLKVRSSSMGVNRGSSPHKYASGLPAYLSVRDQLGRNSLIYAVLGNFVKCLKSLIKSGVNVNEVDASGRSALHWAAIKNLVECTGVLLSSGAKCDLQDREGATPLHLATKHENSKCLQLILKHLDPEPDTYILDNEKRTPLHWNACCAHVENFRLLLKHCCNAMITMRDVAGKTALHWVACSPKMAAADCVRLFFAQEVGAGVVNVSDYEGRTALHCAVIDGIFPVVQELISLPSCNVNLKDNLESTPLHWATILGKHEIVNLLLDHGASVTVHDIDGATPWHYALQNNSMDMLHAYTSRLAVADQRDQNGCTPLMWAASKAANKAIAQLHEFGADLNNRDNQNYTALHVAAFSGHSSTIEILLDLGARLTDVDLQGKTPLFLACEMGHVNAAKTLLKHALPDFSHVVDSSGRTCLHWAASNGHINTCQLLIENGFDPNASDFAGRSPVLYATFHGYIDCMSILKESGGDPEHWDNEGWTALHYACKQGHYDAVKLLLDWNVTLNPKAHSGERFTPLDLATINVHLDVGKFLYKKGGVSIMHIKQMAAIIIQAAYRGYKVRKECKINKISMQSAKCLSQQLNIKNDLASKTRGEDKSMAGVEVVSTMKRENLHRPLEKRLSRSVENLLMNFVDETGNFLNVTNYEPKSQVTGPFKLRRKKFHNCARSELALDSLESSNTVVRSRLKSADGVMTSNDRTTSKGPNIKIDIEPNNVDTFKAEILPDKSSPGSSAKSDHSSFLSYPIPEWCFDPVQRTKAEKKWSDTLANIAFKKVAVKSERHEVS